MELVTLEDRFSPSYDRKQISTRYSGLASSVSPSQTDPRKLGHEVPHFTWLNNDDVLYDALGAQNTRVPGSAFGLMLPETVNRSGFGVFRNKHNRAIVLLTERFSGDNENVMSKNLTESGALGASPTIIEVKRGEGGGYIERTIFPEIRGNVMNRLIQLENEGPNNQPIVIKIVGRPTTWSYVGELFMEYAAIAIDLAMKACAPYVGSFLSIDASTFLSFTPAIQNLAQNKPVTISELATAANLVVPAEFRSSIKDATTFYEKVQAGDYKSAAQQFGIDVNGVNRIMNDYAADVSKEVENAAQSLYIMDTINQVRGSIKSGTAKQEIINNGTITKTPALQNMMLTAMTTPTAAIPRAIEVAGLTASETNDLQTAAEWRGIYQIAHGVPVSPCSLDRIALKGLTERAWDLYRRGYNKMSIPDIVPADKRDCFADEIRAKTGMNTQRDGGISPMVALLGVAGAAGIAYLALRK